jgi:quercetin dioxygenase-like cupin family protein
MGEQRSIIATDQVRVRIMELAAGEELAFHSHSEVTDSFFGLTGKLLVTAKEPAESWRLGPGDHCEVVAPRPHSVKNLSPDLPASYLLVQGVGRYDFNQL